ncbi:hypothetical protein [Nocardia sp. XZ_19_369]|uniref:hypothetical protein n=1 Tax=Nocardia sp. XZ_19_369 TaxID=2769487 RepID=UPI00188FB677|nr:hypothetical protein [Nocardia sp. XZ_19_369]
MKITEHPVIDTVTKTDRGYRARALCLVDDQPADIVVTIDTARPSRSCYRVDLYDRMQLVWNPVLRADGDDFAPPPASAHNERTLAAYQSLFNRLHDTAEWIVRTARDLGPRW